MKKILLKTIFHLTISVAVLCSLNIFAQNSHAVLTKHDKINRQPTGNIYGRHIPFKDHEIISPPQKRVNSVLNSNSLIPIMDSLYFWHWDTLATAWYLYPFEKIIGIVYNPHDMLIQYITQDFNGAAWVNTQNNVNTYDINNNLATALVQTWSGTAWVNSYQDIYTYDAANNMTQDLNQNWSGTAWVNNYQYIDTYNATNKLTQELYQNWSGTAWTNVSLDTYTYNSLNYETNEVEQTWTGIAWVNNIRSDYSYDANNNVSSILNGSWNGIAWDKTTIATFTYDATNHKTTELDQAWSGTAWSLLAQGTFLYDSHYNLTCNLEQKWGASSWLNEFKESLTYDNNDFNKTVVIQMWNSTGAYIKGGDSMYYYFHTVMGIPNATLPVQNISVYPNPVTTTVTIEIPKVAGGEALIDITNIQGQLIKTFTPTGNKTNIDVSAFPSGVYIVEVKTEKGVVVRKFIKE